MKFDPTLSLLLLGIFGAGLPLAGHAALSSQGVYGPNGELQVGSANHVGMARSGRYVAFTSITNGSALYVRDIKTQTSVKISNIGEWNYYAISPNGRYVAYFNTSAQAVILDRVAQTQTVIPAAANSNIGLSDNGYALFNKTAAAGGQLVLFRLQDGSSKIVSASSVDLGSLYERNPLSADGQIALFKSGGVYRIYNAATQSTLPFTPQWAGVPLNIGTFLGYISLSPSGKYIVFGDGSGYLYRATLQSGSYALERYNLNAKFVREDFKGLSISANGRFVSFAGNIRQGHPEWAAANAIEPDTVNQGYPRILRYDIQSNQLTTLSVAHDGGPIRQKADAGSGLWPLVNSTSIVSDDGSMVEFATNAGNIISTPVTSGGEQNYHSHVSNGFARNYLFVDMPNSDNGFKPYAPMTLVGNHQWEGLLRFDGVGTEAFKFDAGGKWLNGVYTPTPNWAVNFGAGGTAGQAVANGSNIPVSSGGLYKVTFNDQTLQYSIVKQPDWQRTVIFVKATTSPGQHLFLIGGIDHAYAQSQLGLNCTTGNYLCAIPIRYRNTLNPYTANWKTGDNFLDWYGREATQSQGNANGLAHGSVMDWTTNNANETNKVAINGLGYTPLNSYGPHYWMLDVDIDCSKTANGWFELKSVLATSSSAVVENNVSQAGTPYVTGNHFARCGQRNVFERDSGTALINAIP